WRAFGLERTPRNTSRTRSALSPNSTRTLYAEQSCNGRGEARRHHDNNVRAKHFHWRRLLHTKGITVRIFISYRRADSGGHVIPLASILEESSVGGQRCEI